MPIPVSRTSIRSSQLLPLVATPRGELLATDSHDDLAPFRELHRVRQEVEEDLTEPTDVADKGHRHRVVDRVDELQLLARGGGSDDVERRFDRVTHDEGIRVELDPTRLDLREVEDVVDDRQERVTRRPDRLGEVALLAVEAGVEEQAAHPDDRVERRPDLVAHRREEAALRLVGLLGELPCLLGIGEKVRVLDGHDGLLRQAGQEVQIRRSEWRLAHRPPDRHQAGDLATGDQRRRHQAVRVVARARYEDRAGIPGGVIDDLAGPAESDAAEDALARLDR